MQQFKVIGIMSGSSLDGADLCYAEFTLENDAWTYNNLLGETIPYNPGWQHRLEQAGVGQAEDFIRMHIEYGQFLAGIVNSFIAKHQLKVDLIASHGHTIFHQPNHRFTCQVGDGASLYALTGIPTVTDFRNVDLALGGQGAPLVPVGERDLFDHYGMFLNLGGIANLSIFDKSNKILAYDICPCNLPLNILCEKYYNKKFDEDGLISSRGKLNNEILETLKGLKYFHEAPPKSLGREFILGEYLEAVEAFSVSPEDKLHTLTHHSTDEISKAINRHRGHSRESNVLVTGGGVYNQFFMEILKNKCEAPLIIPPSMIIEFKEALIFAYLGILRVTNKTNALSSVTNASSDSIGGALWG